MDEPITDQQKQKTRMNGLEHNLQVSIRFLHKSDSVALYDTLNEFQA